MEIFAWGMSMILALLLFNAFLQFSWGGGSKEDFGKALEGTLTIAILYFFVVGLSGVCKGIPFLSQLENGETLSGMLSDLPVFSLECSRLVSLTFLISYLSALFPSGYGGSGLTGRIIRGAALALAGILANHYVMSLAEENEIFLWAVSAMQCFLTGTALVVTPAALLGNLLNLSPGHPIVAYLIKELPKTSVGKALSSAVTDSLVLVFSMTLVESQTGSLPRLVLDLTDVIGLVGPLVLMVIGIRLAIRVLTRT